MKAHKPIWVSDTSLELSGQIKLKHEKISRFAHTIRPPHAKWCPAYYISDLKMTICDLDHREGCERSEHSASILKIYTLLEIRFIIKTFKSTVTQDSQFGINYSLLVFLYFRVTIAFMPGL